MIDIWTFIKAYFKVIILAVIMAIISTLYVTQLWKISRLETKIEKLGKQMEACEAEKRKCDVERAEARVANQVYQDNIKVLKEYGRESIPLDLRDDRIDPKELNRLYQRKE